MNILTEATLKAQIIVDNLKEVLNSMETPTHIDRRLDRAGRKKSGSQGDPLHPSARPQKSPHPTLSGQEKLSGQKKNSGQKKTSGRSRRQAERESYTISIEFISKRGHCHRGISSDISFTGVRLIPSLAPTNLDRGEEGMLRLLDDPIRTTFPSRVVKVSPAFIALQIVDNIPEFETLVAQMALESVQKARA